MTGKFKPRIEELEMEFTFVMVATMMWVVLEGFISHRDGAFSSQRGKCVNLSFLKHGATYGDFFFLSVINGLFVPHLFYSNWYILSFFVSLVVCLERYKAWWPEPGNRLAQGYILYNADGRSPVRGLWPRATLGAGWVHFVLMEIELMLISGFIFTPMPRPVVLKVLLLFVPFILLAIVQPGLVQGGGIERMLQKENQKEFENRILVPAVTAGITLVTVVIFKLYING